MTPVPDRQYDDAGKLIACRRPNWALEAEARCAHVKPQPTPADGYVPEFGDIHGPNPDKRQFGRRRPEPDDVVVGDGA